MPMKILMGLVMGGWLLSSSAWAENVRETNEETCQELLQLAETVPETSPYDLCGFSDPDLAWNKWAPFSSKNKLRRALFELCQRYPAHEYAALYCKKSEELGYPPALIKAGVGHLNAGRFSKALEVFTTALKDEGLTGADEAAISENLGRLYTTQGSPYFNPRVGVPLLQKGALLGSAVANNILGFLSTWGQLGVAQNTKEGLQYYWRAALLGCPSGEENIGLLHLVRQNRIPPQQGFRHMMQQSWTCEPLVRAVQEPGEKMDCDCQTLLESERVQQSQPYRLIQIEDQSVLLRDQMGNEFLGHAGEKLNNGVVVVEVGVDYATVLVNGQRSFLQLVKETPCQTYCARFYQAGGIVDIKPYRFTFSPSECEDIYFYAAHLIGLEHDFVGKKECARIMGEMDSASRLLLEERKQEELDALAPSETVSNETPKKAEASAASSTPQAVSGVQQPVKKAQFALPTPDEPDKKRGVRSRRRTK